VLRVLRRIVLSSLVLTTLSLYSQAAFAMNYNAELREEQKRACEADVMKFCKDDMPDEAKITSCMKTHKPNLSAPCLEMFKKAGQ
jgi:hypothetical protein